MTLPLDAKIIVISKITDDYFDCVVKDKQVPQVKEYKISSSVEGTLIRQGAREAAYKEFDIQSTPIKKLAFDTRRTNQEKDRNPRRNLQYWHRTDPFIDEEDNKSLNIFAKLLKVLKGIKETFGTSPEWFDSYARQLHDNLFRVLRIKEADGDIFRPQLSYLEQIIFARYRLSMENIKKLSEDNLKDKILAKDEKLIGREDYINKTSDNISKNNKKAFIDKIEDIPNSKKDVVGNQTQESIVNAIFGDGTKNIRREGERTVERTITIKIIDSVID